MASLKMKKFYIVIIDSCWPTKAHEALQQSIKLLKEYLDQHHLVIFSEEESGSKKIQSMFYLFGCGQTTKIHKNCYAQG